MVRHYVKGAINKRRAAPHTKREYQAYFKNLSCTHKNFKNTMLHVDMQGY